MAALVSTARAWRCGWWARRLGEEAAVAVAEEEGVVAGWELREEVGAGALQERAEGEVFGEAVDAGYGVEVGGGWGLSCHLVRRGGGGGG